MLCAAIDIGSNTTRVLVAEPMDGQLKKVMEQRAYTRINKALDDDGAILLVRLAYRDGWGLPGGLIKRNEDVADCARREVAEEIGVEVELTSAPAVVVDSRPQRIDVVYRARLAAGVGPDAAVARSAEIREVRWFRPDDLPPLQHEAIGALRALAGPFPQARFCPTGGVGEANAAAWLAEPNVVVVGGSWLCPAADIRSGNWSGITAICNRTMKMLERK